MSFKAYEAYRPSGLDWVDCVPKHWTNFTLKHLANLGSGESITSDLIEADGLYPVFGGNGLRGYTAAFTHEGNFVIIGRQGALCGNIKYASDRFWASEHAVVVTPTKVLELCWLGELLRAMNLNNYSTSAAQPGLAVELIASLPVPVPPLAEQRAIVAFIVQETAKIDALVDDQRRLIELLKEKRQAIISHAVTKGLDPNAPMKDSGIEWLGKVPEHWEVKPLKHLTAPGRDIMYGIVLPGPSVDEGIPIVKGGDVKERRMQLELLCRTTAAIEAPFARARLLPNDIVYSIRGTIGDAEIVPDELRDANITQDVARVSPCSTLHNRWLLYALKSRPIFVQVEQRSLGAAIRGINIFDLKRARVPLPPYSEQQRIADFLDHEKSKLDGLVSAALAAIHLLQERRSALISAAVTGKIDVRSVVTNKMEAA